MYYSIMILAAFHNTLLLTIREQHCHNTVYIVREQNIVDQ